MENIEELKNMNEELKNMNSEIAQTIRTQRENRLRQIQNMKPMLKECFQQFSLAAKEVVKSVIDYVFEVGQDIGKEEIISQLTSKEISALLKESQEFDQKTYEEIMSVL